MAIWQAVILVGGRGSRLGHLTRAIPKPLLPVAGRPFLSYLIDAAVARGIRDFVFLAGHFGEQISHMLENHNTVGRAFRQADIHFQVVVEPAPAGTAGALRHARKHIADEFFLLNGDSFFDFDWLDLTEMHTPRWLGRIALRRVSDTTRYGSVNLNGDKIRVFSARGSSSNGVINAGVYLLRRAIIDHISRTPMSLETEVFPALAETGRLYGRTYEGYFIDIGVPQDLARAETEMVRFSGNARPQEGAH